jgi:GH15 family glucan-1,4-alpha-glucosidase
LLWHRYNCGGYGEHDDGGPYDGTGRGRGWPLLTGERGHYELATGRDPLPYLKTMCRMASPAGMLPEQVWDADPIPSRRLGPGRPTGSAMPLVWTHAEFADVPTWIPGSVFTSPRSTSRGYCPGRVSISLGAGSNLTIGSAATTA